MTKLGTCGQDCDHLNNNQCPACNLQLSTRQSLKRHLSHWHKGIVKDRLDEYLTEFDAQGKEYMCLTCSKIFSRSNILKDHQEKVHGETRQKQESCFSCPFPDCTVKSLFYFVKELLQHCDTCHKEQLG